MGTRGKSQLLLMTMMELCEQWDLCLSMEWGHCGAPESEVGGP